MCFELDSQPPIAPIAGAAVDAEDLALRSTDGTEFAAYAARASEPKGPAVVVMPDVRGLFRFYEELALRLAEQGYDSIAIDYFGRTAGVGKRDDEFPFQEHVAQTKLGYLTQDVAAAVRELRARPSLEDRPVFTVGFCFGGSNSWLQAAGGHGLAGAIGFYGNPTRPGRDGSPPVIDRVAEFECPVLGLMGGDDPGIPAEEVQRYRDALTEAGVEHDVRMYDGAPHSFFDRRYEEHADASADAWERVLAFIQSHSGALAGAGV
jgi:carboxymethylenebutenolidase